MSDSTASPDLRILSLLIKDTTSELKDIDRSKIKTDIITDLKELPLKKGKVKLTRFDSSYKLRYQYAVAFWKQRTDNKSIASKKDADDLIGDLKKELNSSVCIYPEAEEIDYAKDTFFFKETKSKPARKQSSPVWYVICKCENKFYVKSADRNEIDVEIDRKDIESCDYELICPGDEVQVNTEGTGQTLDAITKSTGLTSAVAHDAKARFIRDLLTRLLSGESSALTVFDHLCERYQGIWNHIKNDRNLSKISENLQSIKDILQLSSLLSKKLSKSGKTRCQKFLEELSASLFFIDTLPKYIQHCGSELNRDEIDSLKSLLKLMMQFTPQTATKVWDVAEYIANIIHEVTMKEDAKENPSTYSGVQYLVQLGKILAKSVEGYQDVDTSNCKWNELPTIPTAEEILTAFDLNSLDQIRRDKPYDSTEQYLGINYRLLREECFRNLCTAIQDFREEQSYDLRKMKMYRITLNTVYGGDSQIFLALCCDDCDKIESEEGSEEIDNTSNGILYGSLMCISLNKKFDTFVWATVVQYDLQQKSNKKTVFVRLCSDRNKKKDIDVLLELLTLTNEGDHALMAESATFFPSFGPSMDRLKEMHENSDMPLVEELVRGKVSAPPDYTQDKKQTCDWNIIFKRYKGYEITNPSDQPRSPIEQYEYIKDKVEVSQRELDETQMKGIKNFLENRVSLIQGPPGTGKSFLGAKILRLMLSMKICKRYGGPILVMTYKNNALDHFLGTFLQEMSNAKVVRIGNAGKVVLDDINLRNVRKERGVPKQLLADRKATKELRRSRIKLKSLFKCLSNPVFTLQSFLQAASEYDLRCLLTMSPDLNENISEDIADDLLFKWKQNDLQTQLKELVKKSLSRWLPKDKLKEKFRCCTKKGQESGHQGKRVAASKKSDGEECFEDAIDKTVLAQERQKDALEEDFMEDRASGNDIKQEESGYQDESLTEDVKIPFFYKHDEESEKVFVEDLNLWELSDDERLNFIGALQSKLIREFRKAVTSYEENARKHQELRNEHTVEILKEFDVIGMTITGAATRLHLLNELKPCAVIVEEAAEIIEGQLVSVLPPTIKHLIMLGDQEQLKPRISCYALRQKEKNLDCSMFERLIKNKLPFQQLGRQCRMHEEVAELLCSLGIYENLTTNKEKTSNNNPPDCIKHRLYFKKHTRQESQVQVSKVIWNKWEIDDILDVAVYLMKNEYSPGKVTVLCPYRGQVVKMKAEFKKKSIDPSQKYFTKLKDINITTVDSFQGEENDVILLSMVRCNDKGQVGFFNERNRICVAISRAKCALYFFGNLTIYSTSQHWEKIITLLEEKNLVGKRFPFTEDRNGVSQEKDDENPIRDTTKLSTDEINRLSWKIINKWHEIARLANLERGKVDNVSCDHVNYQQPVHKAARILEMINDKPNFSRKKLASHFKEVMLLDTVDCVLNGTFRNSGPKVDDPAKELSTVAEGTCDERSGNGV